MRKLKRVIIKMFHILLKDSLHNEFFKFRGNFKPNSNLEF